MKPLIFLLLGVLFFFKSYFFIDPDFGWHLKMGELILSKGIPKTDPFSYTMPSFPFVDHEWLTNILYFHLYQTIGPAGMAFLLTSIGLVVILIIKSQNQSRFFLTPLLLTSALLLPFWGVRPQTETWFLTAILLTIISQDSLWTKWRWLLPLYFILWANLHGGFATGLVVLSLALGIKGLTQKRIIPGDLILVALCFGVTLINPYGFNLWKEVWQQLSDGNLRWTISEWTPLIFDSSWILISFIPLLAFSGALIYHFRAKLPPFQLSLYILLLAASLSSLRHTPLWAVVTLPIISQCLQWFYEEIKPIKLAQVRFNKIYRFSVTAAAGFFLLQGGFYALNIASLQENNRYPVQAIRFLKQYPHPGKIFASYGWGGYLIWKLPEQKVFVDGRMPSWRWQPPSQQESPAAFDEYNKVLNDPSGLRILKKYGVQLILWPTEKQITENFSQKMKRWERQLSARLFSIPTIPTLEEKLTQGKWQKIYQDPVATIYQRPATPSP